MLIITKGYLLICNIKIYKISYLNMNLFINLVAGYTNQVDIGMFFLE